MQYDSAALGIFLVIPIDNGNLAVTSALDSENICDPVNLVALVFKLEMRVYRLKLIDVRHTDDKEVL